MYDTVTATVIRAYGVTERQFACLPAVLQCLRGDLGRYKATDDSADLHLFGHHFKNVTVTTVANWLREQNITHEIEQTSRWEPGDPPPAQMPAADGRRV